MTHEESIKRLQSEQRRIDLEYDTRENHERYEAYEMAIAALEEQITKEKDIQMYRNILTNAGYGEQLD